MSKKIIILILVILAVVVILIVFKMKEGKKTASTIISASGIIEATEVEISSKVPGKVLEILVDEGDEVQDGQVIAQLDRKEIEAQVAQGKAALASAEARLAEVLQGARPEQIEGARAALMQASAAVEGAKKSLENAKVLYDQRTAAKQQVDVAEAQLKVAVAQEQAAKARLQQIQTGARPEEIEQARASLEQAQAALENARANLERTKKLYRQGAVSAQQLEAAQTQHNIAEAQHKAAQERFNLVKTGARKEEIEQAKAGAAQMEALVEGAKKSLENAKKLYEERTNAKQLVDSAKTHYEVALAQRKAAKAQLDLLLAGARAEEIKIAEEQVNQAKAGLNSLLTALENTIIKAPISGAVLSKNIQAGEVIAAGTPIVTLADLETVWLKVYILEMDIGKVRIGQEARLTVDSYPEEIFIGKVVEKAKEAEFTPKNTQTKEERVTTVFEIKIRIVNRQRKLHPGMPADAECRVNK